MARHSILDILNDTLRKETLEKVREMEFPPGQILFSAGQNCQGLPLVMGGRIKVQMTGVSGHSIVLYRMGEDDICTLSIGCLMTGRAYRAEAVVEEQARVMMIPRGVFDPLMDQSAGFRLGIMESYGRRLEEWLLGRAARGPVLITHQELAVELGTAREVVSRLLKELEKRDMVRLSRGRIEVTGLLESPSSL